MSHSGLTIFLDRDGVINRKRVGDYVKNWAEFEFLPMAKEALYLLTKASHRLIVVTNQRGVARGLMTERDVSEIHDRMRAELDLVGARIAGVYCCFHDVGQCNCRKPGTGLLLRATNDFPDIALPQAVMIGDSPSDMEAGARVGCRTIFIGHDARYACAESLHAAATHYLV
jgi:histidinol-phosphate phosphatase family protein